MRRDGCSGIAETDVTDPNGNVRKVTFNSDGYILSDTRASGKQEQQTLTYIRDGSDRILSVTDALNRTISFTHDGVGNITSDIDGKVAPEISITPISIQQPPFPLPAGVRVPIYFTIKPGGGYIAVA